MYRIFVLILKLGNKQSAEQAYCVNRLKMQPVKMSSVIPAWTAEAFLPK